VLQVEIFKKSNKKQKLTYSLSGVYSNKNCTGIGIDEQGNKMYWSAQFIQKNEQKDSFENKNEKATQILSKINYPFTGYGNEDLPKSAITLFKNATVWTNETAGNLANTDVLVNNGKIVQIGNNITAPPNAKIIDATNKHLTAGIIDEHAHIAVFSINEGAQSITSEVRIKDNLNPDDINIYRQLSGGVTSAHILHGSANTIGGQTQLIKLKWGENEDGLMFKNWDPFIKFALGENVKRTTAQNNNRFPDTRMGVEQVLDDAFSRATQYEKEIQKNPTATRKNLELDALVEIMNKKRFITCHSYLQSEIVSTMRIAEKYNFKINTFTHILEGYKVADKMKKHGANVSTFSDWWAYKTEVQDAIAYNAAIMHKVGLNVCINSDDAEMARRLNQEAGKVLKYGNVSEIEAFKMVTLNPAIALHISDRVGSIKVNKDADLVLWSENPLSIYAKAEITMIEGAIYFDRNIDLQKRKEISQDRNRLIQKMMEDKKKGNTTIPLQASVQNLENCNDHQ
ncbi:MAG: amidohydrolase, partial [Sediminibacterium sp.]|nr:amidohydrolase [Sediminibacterium sp.]